MNVTPGDAQPGRGFAMVPAWLAWKQPSANALLVYVHLALFGTFNPGTATYEECRPSKRTLAQGDPKRGYPGTGLSEATVGRALRELEKLKAIKGEPSFNPATGAQLPTVYRLVFGQVLEETAPQTPVSLVTPPPPTDRDTPPPITGDTPSHLTSDRGAHVTADKGGVSPVTHNQEPFTKNPLTKSSDHPSDDRPADGDAIDQPVQPTLTGEVPEQRQSAEPSTHDRAMGIARGWIDYRAKQNTPIVGSNVLHQLRSLIKPFLDAGYTDLEVKRALNGLGEGIPSKAQMERALVRIRQGRAITNGSGRGRPTPEAIDVNAHWDQVATAEQPAAAGVGAGW